MSKQQLFKVNDRVNFMAWTVEVEYKHELNVLKSFVGYVKQVRKGRFKTSYAICVAKTDDMYVVPEKDIFCIVDRKEYKQSKSNENGN